MLTLAVVRHRLARIIVVAATVLIAALVALFTLRPDTPPTYFVAYLGRYANPDFDRLHEVALRDYIDALNDEIINYRLELRFHDTKNDPSRAQAIYRDVIAPDPRYLCAIDNTWGKDLRVSRVAIKDQCIPVISTNADSLGIDYGHNVVFVGGDDHLPRELVTYLSEVLQPPDLLFITEAKYDLTARFRHFLAESKLSIETLEVPDHRHSTVDEERLFAEIRSALNGRRDRTILLNVHADWGTRILQFLGSECFGATILGGPYITGAEQVESFGENRNENTLLMVTRSTDTASSRVFQDIRRFKHRHPEVLDGRWQSPLFVKRCVDAVEIMRAALLSQTQPTRAKFAGFLRGLRGATIRGRNDLYTFDDEMILAKEMTFEARRRGQVRSAPRQLNAKLEVIPNVSFGLDIINMGDIDPDNNSFYAEFYYWLRRPKTEDEKSASDGTEDDAKKQKHFIQFRNLRRADREITVLERDEDDYEYALHRVSGEFHATFDLRRFPLDTQELAIQVEMIDPFDAVRVSFDSKGFQESKKNIESFRLRSWRPTDYFMTVDNVVSTSVDGRHGPSATPFRKFKVLSVRLQVEREPLKPFITIILPLAMIGLAAVALLYVRNLAFDSIGEVCIGVFLTIVTYSIAYAEIKPASTDLTRADILFYMTFVISLATFLTILALNAIYPAERLRNMYETRVGRVRYVMTAIFLGILVALPLL